MKEEIIGSWILKNGRISPDSNCELIESMIKNELEEIEVSEDGWTKRYQDKNGAVWVLTFPESHLQGGGPPKLMKLKA